MWFLAFILGGFAGSFTTYMIMTKTMMRVVVDPQVRETLVRVFKIQSVTK